MFSTLTRSPVSNVFLNIAWFNLASAIFLVRFADIFLATRIDYRFGLRAQNYCVGVPASSSLNFKIEPFCPIYQRVCDLLENLSGQNC